MGLHRCVATTSKSLEVWAASPGIFRILPTRGTTNGRSLIIWYRAYNQIYWLY